MVWMTVVGLLIYASASVVIAMCSIGLSDCEGLYRQEVCHPKDPRLLGFEAQRVLIEASHAAESAGEPFDYIAYLEDDILLTDADFFLKLRYFNRSLW